MQLKGVKFCEWRCFGDSLALLVKQDCGSHHAILSRCLHDLVDEAVACPWSLLLSMSMHWNLAIG